MGCGGGGSTNTVVQNSQPPQWLQNNLQSLYNQAQSVTNAPLQQYTGQTVAPFNASQQGAFNTVDQSQGLAAPFYNQAQQLITNASQPINFTPVNGSTIAQYESPYQSQVIGTTEAQLQNMDAQQQQQLLGQAIQSGASPFGGDRAGIAAAALAGQQALANNQTIAGLENQGYTTALGEANTQQQQALAAQEASQYLGQQGAFGLTNLGTTAENTALGGASAQLQSGALQQQLAQEQLNVPYEQFIQRQAYPYQQLSALEQATGLAGGLAGGTSSTTSPGPSTGSQIAGLGTAGLGAYVGAGGTFGGLLKKGGVAHYDGGGIVLPAVPDLSISYMQNSGQDLPQIARSNIPKPPPPMSSSGTQNNNGSLANNIAIGKALKSILPSGAATSAADNLSLDTSPVAMANVFPGGAGVAGTGMYDIGSPSAASGFASAMGGAPALDSSGIDALAGSSELPGLSGATAGLSDAGATAAGDSGLMAALSSIGDTLWAAIPTAAEVASFFALKKGGRIPHMDTGGLTAFDQSSSPMQNNITQKFAQMNPQQLRQLMTRIPPQSPYAQLIGKVLQQKQMMPNVGQGIAAGAPSAPVGIAPSMAKGGLAHYDDGGDIPSDAVLAADPSLAPAAMSPDNASKMVELYSDNDTPHAPDIENEKDNPVNVDHSGDTVKVHSNEGTLDLGIPSQPAATSQETTLQKLGLPIMAAGFGMMAGQSPHALTNIGAGAAEGIKTYEEQQKQALEQQKENQAEKYQTGELTVRQQEAATEAQRLAQEGKYQDAEIVLRRAELGKPELVKDALGNPIGWSAPGSAKLTPISGLPDYSGGLTQPGSITSSSPNAQPGSGLTPPSVGTYLNSILLNSPAQAKDIDTYLSRYPQQVVTHAELIASGEEAFPTGFAAAKNPILMQAVSLAKEINPTITAASFPTLLDFTKGSSSNTVRALNTAIPHLDTLGKLATALDNNDTKTINQLSNAFKSQFGQTAPTNFDTAKQIVADEVVKAVVGAGGSQFDREQAQKVIDKANSPEQLKEAINTYQNLMAGQLSSLQQKYEAGTGRKDFQTKFLTPHTRDTLSPYLGGSATQGNTSTPPILTATGPNGKKLQLVNGQWIPIQ